VARELRKHGLEFEEVRVPQRRQHRLEIRELTGQDWVPVIVDGQEVVYDSHRIVEYLSSKAGSPAR
jgi:glutathione S-transferase